MTQSSNGLSFTCSGDDGDGLICIEVRVQNSSFAGTGMAWFYRDTLNDLAAKLAPYPLQVFVEWFGGHGGSGDGKDPAEETIRLSFRPLGSKGQLQVSATLSDPWVTSDAVEASRVATQLMTSYEALREFVGQLKSMAAGTSDSANLREAILS